MFEPNQLLILVLIALYQFLYPTKTLAGIEEKPYIIVSQLNNKESITEMNIHVPNTGSFRSATDMEILERPLEWLRDFQSGWLSHFEKTGIADWSLYTYPTNYLAPASKGVDLAHSRVLLISTAGAYYPAVQRPFNCDNPLGDYTIRIVPSAVPLESMVFGHPGVNQAYVEKDPEVLLPLEHLRSLVEEKYIGSLAPIFITLCGVQPHAIRVVKELIPNILKVAKEYQVQAAMIIPADQLCIQTAGLIARALEVNNIAATMTTWDADMAYMSAPPRLTATYLPAGCPIGMPGDKAQQRRILKATLDLLEVHSPTGIIYLSELASS